MDGWMEQMEQNRLSANSKAGVLVVSQPLCTATCFAQCPSCRHLCSNPSIVSAAVDTRTRKRTLNGLGRSTAAVRCRPRLHSQLGQRLCGRSLDAALSSSAASTSAVYALLFSFPTRTVCSWGRCTYSPQSLLHSVVGVTPVYCIIILAV